MSSVETCPTTDMDAKQVSNKSDSFCEFILWNLSLYFLVLFDVALENKICKS